MTKEEVIEILERFVVGAKPCSQREIVNACASAYRMLKEQLSLPSNLDEAAEKNFETMEVLEHENIFEETHNRIFKSGAKWMAGQGVTLEDEVCELYDKLYLYYIDDCSSMTPDTSCEMLKKLGVNKGDKVIVQIRKK